MNAIQNIEASLAYTLASKLVDSMLSLEQQPWILGAMCLIVYSVMVPTSNNPQGFANTASQILVLSLSKLLLLQLNFNVPGTGLLYYIQKFLQTAFIVVMMSVCIKMLLKLRSPASSVAEKQFSTLVINMQRIFADTVASLVAEPDTRRLVVLYGICILPSIARIIAPAPNSKNDASFNISL